jgi:hypothetical protein
MRCRARLVAWVCGGTWVGEETGWSGVAVCLDRDNKTTGWESLTAREPRNRVLPCRPTRYASWLLAPQNARSLSSFAPPGCLVAQQLHAI